MIPDPREHRSRLLDALRLAVLAAAERGPLAVILDDAELADEASLAVLAALAADSGERAVLLIVGVLANTEPSAPLSKLRSRASVLQPAPLPEPAIRDLLGSIFGDVPHVARLAVLVEQRTRGNVVMIMELLRGFVGSGAIRYADGSWVIPREVQSLGEAVRLRDAFAGQVATLEGDTLELAAIWAICGEELSLERVKRAFCAGAAHTPRELFHALDELVYAEILVGAAGAYAFRQEGLRLALVDSLSDERRAELHARVGSAMIAEGALAPAEQLAAAWHLMRAGVERTRGARLVAEALADPRPTAERAEGTVEAVAEALGVLQESGGDQVLRMRLSLSLMRCAYYYDARLADAAMPALDELAEASGLAAARAMPAEVPAAERLERGIAEATARWQERDLDARGLHPATAPTPGVGAVAGAGARGPRRGRRGER